MNKAQILREIKRTAIANGGLPVGWRRFASETGIAQREWFGVYWARWSDALRDAGFAPNQLTGPYENAHLLDKYALLALELGRLPTNADMRLRTRSDPEFPHDATFRRLGTKAKLVAQLIEHCRTRTSFEQVFRWCEDYLAHRRATNGESADESQLVTEFTIGFVYLLKSGRSYKIGKTNAVGRREYELAIQLPERATTVHVIRTDDPDGIEDYWHNRFAAKRQNGEWFKLDAADVAAFKRRRKFM